MTMYEQESVHDAVGAYVLGILDDADASAFEAHLAACDICAGHLEEFSGMEPMLAMLAEAPAPPMSMPQSNNVANLPGMRGMTDVPGLRGRRGMSAGGYEPPRLVPVVPSAPSPRLLGGLLDEVAAKRAAKRRRGMYLVAAAAALIIGGPAAAITVTGDDGTKGSVAAPLTITAEDSFKQMKTKFQSTDAGTKVTATVGWDQKLWGTDLGVEVKNVKGPLKCQLIAVSKTGEEEIGPSWSVPPQGYGIANSTDEAAKKPLYVHGGTAMATNDLDYFLIRTSDGKVLVKVEA